ncbi:hypothetical protein BCY84_00622 [Trypanosoma cruzi cruzi]|uniref:GPR1/FUN34/yaaH family n=1 Tax=Trypanosoma cruzi TaxID=5693 RepID=A0A2V2VF82_TRYCR|nr:hypothetical protein BCY84_00622 [Trypanosoma cruzi cruzi]PWU95089.1 hypothetical protein C4B63_23g6 [Trypanosoma cruzi]
MSNSNFDELQGEQFDGRHSNSRKTNDPLANRLLAALTADEEKSELMLTVLQNILNSNDLALVKKVALPKKRVNLSSLGMLGFGISTILLQSRNAGIFELGSVIPAMGLVMGGGMQLFVGLLEYFDGNAFSAISFLSYGAFWLSLVGTWLLPHTEENALVVKTEGSLMGLYSLLWGFHTVCMGFVAFLRSHRVMQFLFTSMAFLFFLLAAGDFSGKKEVTQAAGYVGIACGSSGLYIAFAEALEESLGYPVLPLFHVKRN